MSGAPSIYEERAGAVGSKITAELVEVPAVPWPAQRIKLTIADFVGEKEVDLAAFEMDVEMAEKMMSRMAHLVGRARHQGLRYANSAGR